MVEANLQWGDLKVVRRMYVSTHWAMESDGWNQGFTVNDWHVPSVGRGNVGVKVPADRQLEMKKE